MSAKTLMVLLTAAAIVSAASAAPTADANRSEYNECWDEATHDPSNPHPSRGDVVTGCAQLINDEITEYHECWKNMISGMTGSFYSRGPIALACANLIDQ